MVEKDSKLLVLAGVHQREIEFSFPVADRLIEHYGGSTPNCSYTGIDTARQAQLWKFDGVAVAKIHRIGEQSEDYLRTLSKEELFDLADFRIKNMFNGTEPAENFGNKRYQWTSVHDMLIEETKPSLILDLHSYHRDTIGMSGTGAYMQSFDPNLDSILTAALSRAQTSHPELYGTALVGCPLDIPTNNYSTAQNAFNRDELISLVCMKKNNGLLHSFLDYLDRKKRDEFRKRISDAKRLEEKKIVLDWGNNWYFRKSRHMTDVPYSFIEAVHWGEEQQKATVKFITQYLIPQITSVHK